MSELVKKNLGTVTAYGYAKSKGYTGTEEEFSTLMASYASVAQDASHSASSAAEAAQLASNEAQTASRAAQTATSKASEASQSASTATTKASEASQSASTASSAASSASTSAYTATAKAGTATAKANEAAASEAAALSAKTDAETARDAAAQSASEAAESARTLTIDATLTQSGQAADSKVVGDEIGAIKEDLNANNQALIPLAFTLTQNKMIDGTDGVERESNAFRYASDYIDIENITKIDLYSAFRNNYGAAFYDEYQAFISGVVAATGYNEQPYLYKLNVPEGAKYFRFTVYVVNMVYTDAYLGISSTHNDFKNYVAALNENNKSAYSLDFTLTSQKMIDGANGTEYSASASYSASNQIDVEGLTKIKLYSAFNNEYGCAFYDANGVYISGEVVAEGYNQQPYTYELDVPSGAKYFRFTVCSVNMTASSATLKVPTAQTDIINSIKTLKNTKVSADIPITDMPSYIRKSLCYKPLGSLSKGYILLSCDDGTEGLATYTIPMIIEKGVPCTFGLLSSSVAVTDETYLATVVDAVTNHDCCVALHGSGQWTTYTESGLYEYLVDLKDTLEDAGITKISGAICPGGNRDDTSTLVQAVAGGLCGAVFSGNRSDKIAYGNYKANGARTNMYDLDRKSAIGFTTETYQAAIDEAYDNHYILCPFWHDYSVVNDTAKQAIIEGMIDYAKTKGLTFITMADLPTII